MLVAVKKRPLDYPIECLPDRNTMAASESIQKIGQTFGRTFDEPLNPLVDGRQSEAALAIARGTQRCLIAHGFASLAELTLRSGRRADLIALADSGEIWIIEIKSSLADFRADQKWPEYREFCDRFFFAVGRDFPQAVLPADTGLIVADRFGAEILREAPEHKLAAARRKTLTTTFARVAALRIHAITDPDLVQKIQL